jgi:D-sedoheptulose 7-phosphate isomerase
MASHMATEFICKVAYDRQPLPAIALTVDTSMLTAISNDYNFSDIFKRQIQALGKPEDILIVFTTSLLKENSTHSLNIKKAIDESNKKGIKVIYAPRVGKNTAAIQEHQLHWLHYICQEIEKKFL